MQSVALTSPVPVEDVGLGVGAVVGFAVGFAVGLAVAVGVADGPPGYSEDVGAALALGAADATLDAVGRPLGPAVGEADPITAGELDGAGLGLGTVGPQAVATMRTATIRAPERMARPISIARSRVTPIGGSRR